MSNTSIGRGPGSGGNENRDGDPRNKTLGEKVGQEAPAGSVEIESPPEDDPVKTPGEKPRSEEPKQQE